MGLAGTVVQKTIKGGAKVLTKGTKAAVNGTKELGSSLIDDTKSLLTKNKSSHESRVKQAESLKDKVVKEIDTSGKTYNGFQI